MELKENGAKYVKSLIDQAVENGTRTATVTGNYEIEEVVKIPSDFTLILEDCYLRQKDGIFDNVFTNEHHDTPEGLTIDGRDKNIKIIGRGRAVIDGGEYNGLSERNSGKNCMPEIWKNNLIIFTNVENFEVCGIKCQNQRWWALNFVCCAYGKIHDIEFCSLDTWKDENGVLHKGLLQEVGQEPITIVNSDGIDLRLGCHHIEIENITGFTEDDTIALTAIRGRVEKAYFIPEFPEEICHISIKNIHASAFCAIVRLLNQGGTALHDVSIDGVYDTSENSPHLDRGMVAVRVGDTWMYGDRVSTKDETYNICIKNVRSRAGYALSLAGATRNATWENVTTFDGGLLIEDHRTEVE